MDEDPTDEGPGVTDRSEWTLRDGAAREFVADGVSGVASLVRSTYGPKGLETMVETETPQGDPEVVLSADSGEIFAAVERADGFSHPVSALLVDAVDSMGRALGDGGTATTLLAEAFVSEGLDLVEQGLHPNAVTVGYAMAAAMAGEVLDDLARPVDPDDEETLGRVAATAMGGAFDPDVREIYAGMVARAVASLSTRREDGFVDTDDVKVVGTTDAPTASHEGVVVRRWPRGAETSERSNAEFDWSPSVPGELADAGVAVIDAEIDFEETATNFTREGTGAGVRVESHEALARYREGLEEHVATVASDLRALGVDVLVSRLSVDDDLVEAFERAGVAVVDGVETPEIDVHRIARSTDATVVSHLEDLTEDRLGTAARVTERRVGDEKWTLFEGGGGGVYTLVVGTETDTNAGRCERVVSDAVEVTAVAAMDGQVLPGAGAPAMAVATALRKRARGVSGVEQLAIEGFADALESTVAQLGRNAGLDPVDVRTALRAAHADASRSPAPLGLDLDSGEPTDAYDAGVVEPRRVFSQAIESARAIAEQLLTTDAVFYPDVDLADLTPQTEHR